MSVIGSDTEDPIEPPPIDITDGADFLQDQGCPYERIRKLEEQLKETEANLNTERRKINTLEGRLIAMDLFTQLEKNDDQVRFYTGLDSYEKLSHIFRFVNSCMPNRPSSKLSNIQQFIVTLIRLRLAVQLQDLAYRFQISLGVVSKNVHDWISAMYISLVPTVIFWPNSEDIKTSLPMCFRGQFEKCVCIIDCFEIFMDRPIKIKERASTYSSYKSHNTVKYLIGVTPQGSVSFISTGYGGRVSDKFITENSGFVDLLKEGDVILADKGFTIQEMLGLKNVSIKTPAFKKDQKQLSRIQVNESREISKVRIHVERVIGALKVRFQLLSGPLGTETLNCDENQIPFIDKLVHVACALHNCLPSIVPSY